MHCLYLCFLCSQEMVDSGVSYLTEAVVSFDSYLIAARQHSIHMSNTVSGKIKLIVVPNRFVIKISLIPEKKFI